MSQIHVDDVEAIAAIAYELFHTKHPQEPEWGNLPPSSRRRWVDTVHDYRRTPELVDKPSPNLQEACISQAIREFPPRPEYNPDAAVRKPEPGFVGRAVATAREVIEDVKNKKR